MFLNKVENVFLVLSVKVSSWNITKDEWFAMRGLAKDRSIVILLLSGVGKISWPENHLKYTFTYKEFKFADEDLVKLVDKTNQMFKKFLRN